MTLNDKDSIPMRLLAFLFQNNFTRAGAILTTSAAISLLFFWAVELTSGHAVHPYMGILLFMVLPGLFVLGLMLIPFGAWLQRRRRQKHGGASEVLPPLDFSSKAVRTVATIMAGLTFINVLIVGIAAYRGIEYMDSTQFCGLTCHSVMAPEYTAYQDSPHVRVGCTGCHIGPGAGWFVKSKLSGVHQVWAVNLNTYSRPIPSPVKDLRPARGTCEQCHWPEKFHGDKLIIKTHFADDEANTMLRTVLVMRIGGHANGHYEGIHGRHLDVDSPISYASVDEKRQIIASVTLGAKGGSPTEFVSDEAKASAQPGKGEQRVMDCIDCHNRPSHKMYSPERAMDRALQDGRISTQIPFIRKQGVEALKAAKGDTPQAHAQIAAQIDGFYKQNYADFYRDHKALIDTAIQQIQAAWSRNVFPQMNITWGTYVENLGHEESPGCFRCHDGSHKSKDGKVITPECDACHAILAQDEADPKILKDLNIKS